MTGAPGRPRIIESPEEFDRRVALYVEQCLEKKEKLTLTGLILALGLSSRQSLDEYLNYDGFPDSVKRAKLLIENAYEQQLVGSHAAGPIFALKNFGWKDQQNIEHSGELGLRGILSDIDGSSAGLPKA